MTEWDWYIDDPAWDYWADEDDPPRCELDHPDGGVCLQRLRRDGTCPSHPEAAA